MQQQQCHQLVYIYRDFAKAETFSCKCIHQTTDQRDIKGKTKQATVVQLEFRQSCVKTTHGFSQNSVSFVWRHVACVKRIIRVQGSVL